MQSTSPSMEITCDENGKWKITIASFFRTVVLDFTLGEEYEEHMPGGVIIKVIFCLFLISLLRYLLFNIYLFRAPPQKRMINYLQFHLLQIKPKRHVLMNLPIHTALS